MGLSGHIYNNGKLTQVNSNNTNPSHIEEVIIRFLKKEASLWEVEDLRKWLSESEHHQRKFDEICDVWIASNTVNLQKEYNPNLTWNTKFGNVFMDNEGERVTVKNIHRNFSWKWIAAIFIIAFASGTLFMYFFSNLQKNESKPLYTEHLVPYGSKSEVTLPDGSRVWINSGSRLRYSQNFNHSDRQVTLEGEAYFDVAKNAQKPFLVNTTGITVKVIGTAFNVKAYPDEKSIETTVERGLVQVFSNSSGIKSYEKVFLRPKQKATYLKGQLSLENQNTPVLKTTDNKVKQEIIKTSPLIVHTDVVTKYSTSWKDTRWIIEREELQDLAIKIERRYNVKVDFADTKLKKFVFSGILDDESLEQVLEVIKMSAPINYSLNQKKITLYENKAFINK